MATTMIPPSPSPSPSPKPGNRGELRFVTIRASLMPDEIISGRQTVAVRKQVLLGLVIVVALVIAWFGLSWWQTSSSRSDLDGAQRQTVTLQDQQKQFAPLVAAQTQTQTIQGQLHTLMVGDLSWKDMLTKLRAAAPAGLSLTAITGSVSSTTGTTTGQQPSATTVVGGVGQLTLTGTAHTKNDVAAYSDKLSTVPGLASPLITNVATSATTGSAVTFSMTVAITSGALGGRYATAPAKQTGGK